MLCFSADILLYFFLFSFYIGPLREFNAPGLPTGPEIMLVVDMITAAFGVYILFTFMYYLFRPSVASLTGEVNKLAKHKGKIMKAGAQFGSAMVYVIINSMQVVALVLSKIKWSPDLPQGLVDFLENLAGLFSFDIPSLLTSPDCFGSSNSNGDGGMRPLGKWTLSMLMPFGIVFVFFLWFMMIKWHQLNCCCCCKRKNKTSEELNKEHENHISTILHSAVQVLLIGIYSTVVKTCLQIFDCSEITDDRPAPTLVMDPKIECSDIVVQQVISVCVLLLWALLPFVVIGRQLCRYKMKGNLEEHIQKSSASSTYNILYGWAATKVKEDSPSKADEKKDTTKEDKAKAKADAAKAKKEAAE